MALFKTSPEKQLSNAIGARAALIARLSDAEVVIIERQTAAEQAAMDGADDDALTAAENKLRAAQERRVTLRAALSKSEALVCRLEHERDEAADAAQREKTAAEVELLAREVVEAGEAFVAAAAKLADCSLRASAVVPEAGGLVRFAGACRSEIPAGGDLVAKLLRNHGAAVLARSAPPTLAKPPEAVAPVSTTKPELVQVFLLHACTWRDHGGVQRVSGKWRDCELSPSQAETALRLKLAAPMTDERRKQLLGQSPGHPEPGWLNDIDLEIGPDVPAKSEDGAAVETILASSPFTVVTNGEPRVIQHREAAIR
jgi:hypothetical protein